MRLLAVLCGVLPCPILASSVPRAATFERDVAPILQKHCQSCHRPGEIGPMPLITYQQVRPWAKAIRESILLKKMPPWFADPAHGAFRNARGLTQNEIDTVAGWADGGAPRGDPKDGPPPREFAAGWQMGTPDVVFEMPKEFHVPATGKVEYQWIVMPTGFTEDKWVQAAEVRPGNAAVLHHAVLYTREPGSSYAKDRPMNEFFEYIGEVIRIGRRKGRSMVSSLDEPDHLQVWAPGAEPVVFEPGQARLVKAGSDVVFQLHYTTNGKPGADRTRIGLIFARSRPGNA
jgi:hypothetical protein